jgi:M6 family metalloprotease-like protein
MSKSIHDFYFEQSYGKVDFSFFYTPIEAETGLPESISFGSFAKDYLPTSNSPETFVQKLLDKSKESWKIQNYDGVIYTFLDTKNHDGGYAWSFSPNTYIANNGDKELQSPFGSMDSVVMADFDLNVLEHELGHSIFRFWDLYQHGAPINHTITYDLMGDGISSDKNLFLWHRWLWNWVSDSQIQCIQEQGITRHFISPLNRKDDLVKGVILQRSKNSGVVIENRGLGIILYSIDLSIGNGQGPIKVSQKNLTPTKKGQSINDFGVTVNVLDCFTDGCLISVENGVKGVNKEISQNDSNSGFGIPMMGAEADSKTTGHIYFKAGAKKSYEVQVLSQDKKTMLWTTGILNSSEFEITVNLQGLECSKTYPVLVKIWSELDGKGNLATGANDNQLQTPTCSS